MSEPTPRNVASILSVVGARPQFIKAAVVSRALAREGLGEILVHTGQHYDWTMSAVFFEGLGLREPDYDLQVGSATQGAQTGRMLEAIERVVLDRRPRLVLVYGDTNSTLAGALASAKLHIPVAHVEAGLRSFDRKMPEELNRVLTDHLSDLLFAPTDAAVQNLCAEGISRGVVRTGDVMYDLATQMMEAIESGAEEVLKRHRVVSDEYALVTIHRAENTDDRRRWQAIVEGLGRTARRGLPIIWPAHPRTRELVSDLNLPGVRVISPLPYLDTQVLVRHARVVITDSGGLQKEAAFHQTPCVTVRDQTEWVELVEAGVNHLSGADGTSIEELALSARWPDAGLPPGFYGDGNASAAIAGEVATFLAGLRRDGSDSLRCFG